MFVITDGRADSHPLGIGERNGLAVQVPDGLSAGERVILHPSDEIAVNQVS